MARIPIKEFSDRNITRIFLASSVKTAENVENLLNQSGINYSIELEPFTTTSIFSSEYIGSSFYVLSGQAEYCRNLLTSEGLESGVQKEES